MKVALSFPACNRRGGVERIIYECARYLTKRGHGVTVFATEYEQNCAPILHRHVPVGWTPKFLKPLAFYRACHNAMKGADFDAHGTFGCVCPEGGVYWAQSVHAAWLDKAKAYRPLGSMRRWKQWLNPAHPVILELERRHFRRGNYRKIIALTEDVKADLHRHYGVPEEDMVVIPNGYAPEEFNATSASGQRGEVRRHYGFREDEKIIVFVANELERKGFPALLRAVESLGDSRVRLLVAGRIAPAPHPLVKYVGATSDVARCYAAADVFALPTQYEAWGLVIVEALASGLPVLTSRLAGAAVVVREGVTGNLLDDPMDEAEIAVKLRGLIEGGHAGAAEISDSVADYAWERVLTQYEKVLCGQGKN
jgi:UDP-glucose:(heptosyl)LPS alpha-1,3-glucosyltransferase